MLISHYLKIAMRIITLNKFYSAINLIGLAIGFAACIFIILFVRFELSYDKWMPNSDNIYRYENFITNPGSPPFNAGVTPYIIRQHLIDNFPEMEQVARLMIVDYAVRVTDDSFTETIGFVDENFLQLFELPLISGNSETALYNNNSIIISKRMAVKYFGTDDPMGQNINLNNQHDYIVVAVFDNLPRNSHLNLNFLVRYNQNDKNFGPGYHTSWYGNNPFTYISFKDGTEVNEVRNRLSDFFNRIAPMPFGENGPTPSEFTSPRLKNLRDIHLSKELFKQKIENPSGDINLIYAFIANALLILVIASINFINLSTARSFKRTREIAIRKVVGANRTQLLKQFIGETILLTFIAFFFSLVLVEALLPFYNNFLGLELKLEPFTDMTNLMLIISLVLVIGTLSGLYSAFIATSVRPANSLKTSQISTTSGSHYFRTILIIFQFSITIALCIATSVIYAQQKYMETKDLGFTKSNKIVIRDTDRDYSYNSRITLKNEIKKLPNVKNTAFSSRVPVDTSGGWSRVHVQGYIDDLETGLFRNIVDYDFFKTYDIPIIAGRDFSSEIATDEFDYLNDDEDRQVRGSIIINEGAVKRIGFESNIESLGKEILIGGPDSNYVMTIIGVTPDVNFISLRREVRQGMYFIATNRFDNLTIQFDDFSNINQNIDNITGIWETLIPNHPINYEILENSIYNQYDDIRKQSQVMMAFSLLSIMIACLGLYAITYFTAEQKTKEIAIRKVHGANVSDIIRMLLLELSKPILASNLIAYPVAFILMTEYLKDFTFRINLTFEYFLLTTFVTLLIACFTVSWHAVKTARTKAIHALSTE